MVRCWQHFRGMRQTVTLSIGRNRYGFSLVNYFMDDIKAFAETVYDRFDRLGYCDEEEQQLPPREVLEEVCNVLLNVSCMPEEGRYPAFRVCFIDSDSPFLDVFLYAHVLRFREPVRFNRWELHKLALAMNADMSYLLVDINTDPFLVRGMIVSYTAWIKIMTREQSTGIRMPRIPNIAVTGPGRLEACFGEMTVVSYYAGSCGLFRTDTFTSTLVAQTLRENAKIPEQDRLSLLYRMIWHAKKLEHGGLIFLVPDVEACAPYMDIKYELPVRCLFQGGTDTEETAGVRREKEITAYAGLLARLTAVDGAVILTKDFDLVGFGAELLINPAKRQRPDMHFIGPDDCEELGGRFDDSGMRHRACYSFCDVVEGAVGIVISQEGTVRACTRHDGKVVVYSHVALPIGE